MPKQVKKAFRGRPIPATGFNGVSEILQRNIVGGSGLLARRAGQQLVISSTAKAGPRGGESSAITVDIVEVLPAIPATGIRWVYWSSAGVGTGDKQVWFATEHDTIWTPTQKTTVLSGEVV